MEGNWELPTWELEFHDFGYFEYVEYFGCGVGRHEG